jgi:hypothetical protein
MERIVTEPKSYSLEENVFRKFGKEGMTLAKYVHSLTKWSELRLVGGALFERVYDYTLPKIRPPVESFLIFEKDVNTSFFKHLMIDYFVSHAEFSRDQDTVDIDITSNALATTNPVFQLFTNDRDIDISQYIVIEQTGPHRSTIYTRHQSPRLKIDVVSTDGLDGENSVRSGFSTNLDKMSLIVNKELSVEIPKDKDLVLGFSGDIKNAIQDTNKFKLYKYARATTRFYVQSLYEKDGKQINIDWGNLEETTYFLLLSTMSILVNREENPKTYKKLLHAVITNWEKLRPELKIIIKGAFEGMKELNPELVDKKSLHVNTEPAFT